MRRYGWLVSWPSIHKQLTLWPRVINHRRVLKALLVSNTLVLTDPEWNLCQQPELQDTAMHYLMPRERQQMGVKALGARLEWPNMAWNTEKSSCWSGESLFSHECGVVHLFVSLLSQDIKTVSHSASSINFTAWDTELFNAIRKWGLRLCQRKSSWHGSENGSWSCTWTNSPGRLSNSEGNPQSQVKVFSLWDAVATNKWPLLALLCRNDFVFTKIHFLFIWCTRATPYFCLHCRKVYPHNQLLSMGISVKVMEAIFKFGP